MKITQITVHAGRTFNHPHEQFSNLRPEVILKASIDEDEDPIAAAKELQQRAETLVEDHKRSMLTSLEEIYQLRLESAELADLGKSMKRAQERIDELRKRHPELAIAGGEHGQSDDERRRAEERLDALSSA